MGDVRAHIRHHARPCRYAERTLVRPAPRRPSLHPTRCRQPLHTLPLFTGRYERSALVDHLERNGWDPVTREPCNVKSLHENVALRAAVADYLESHPSLYGEVANEPESMA